MAYKQNFKSPILKALVGKQGNLPQHLQDAIKAAPESPAKMKDLSGDGKVTKKDVLIGRGVLDKDGSPAKNTEPTIVRRKDPNAKTKAPKRAKAGKTVKGGNVYAGAKETTQQRKRLKKEVDSATTSSQKQAANKKLRMAEKQQRAYDKQKSRNASLEKRAKSLDSSNRVDQSKADDLRSRKVSNNKAINVSKPVGKNKAVASVKKRPKLDSPAKVKDPVTGKRVKGYAKADRKVSKVRDRQERKDTKKALKATAKSDGKITRLERKGINKSVRDLKTKQQNKRVVEFQRQKTKDVKAKEYQRLRNKAKKLSDAVAVGYDASKADKKYEKATAKANKRLGKAIKVQARTERNVNSSPARQATDPKKKVAKSKKVGNRTYTIADGLTKGRGKFKKK